MAQFPVFPEITQFPGSMNIQVEPGKIMPAFDHGAMTNSADILHYFIKEAIETTNPSGNPRQYAFGNESAFYFEDGARTDDHDFSDVVQGAAIVDNGSGAKVLIVGFGTGTPDGANEGTYTRDLTTDTTPWTANTAADTTKATFFKIITVGPDAYAATGGASSGTDIGRTILGEYKVAKCPYGSDPTLAASWGNVLPVGTPEWPIIDMAPLADSYCVAKGDGLWYWNSRVLRFQNALARVKFLPHALNGKGMTAGENGVWYPMADGRLFFFDGTTTTEQTPWKNIGALPRDSYQSRASAIADRGDVVAVRTEPFYNSVTGPRASSALGMRAFVVSGVSGATITEITSNVTDGSVATGYVIGGITGIGTRATDAIVIGLNEPAEAFIFRVTRAPNSAVNSLTSPTCSDGAGGFTSLGTIRDGTILKTSGVGFALTGYPPGASEPVVSWTLPNSYDLSKTDTFNSISGLYWYKFSFATTTALTSTTAIDEIDVVPSRGGLPNTGILTSTTNFTHRANAGGIGRVYIGRRTGGKIVWADQYAVDDGGGVWAMAWTTCRSGTMTNGGQPLLLWGRYQQTIIAESVMRDPSLTAYPKLVQGSSTKPYPKLAVRKLVMGDPTTRSALTEIFFEGQYIQTADSLTCYAWWDNEDKPVMLDRVYGNPGHFAPAPLFNPLGRELNFDIIFADANQTDPTAPYISRIVVDYEQPAQQYEMPRDANFMTPEGP